MSSSKKAKGVKRTGPKRPTGYADQIKRKFDAECNVANLAGKVYEQDTMLIALKRMGLLGPKRVKALDEMLRTVRAEYAQIGLDDSKEDKELAYTKYKIDEELRFALGDDNFVAWDARYNPEIFSTGIRSLEILRIIDDIVEARMDKIKEDLK